MVMSVLALLLLGAAPPWPTTATSTAIAARIPPPEGYTRIAVEPGSFGAWLRALPVKVGRPQVMLFDGRAKRNQEAHAYVLDVDVGPKDLQQCADFVMRLFAEYQWSVNATDRLCFRFTSGDRVPWSRWAAGDRPVARGNKVSWSKGARADASYGSFRRYLDAVFNYAGTFSLARDLGAVADRKKIALGDVFIQGGFPGHAVVVVDVVEDAAGARRFMIAQSFMPAQDPHVLMSPEGAWYRATGEGDLDTPEWTFRWTDLKRFGASACP